MNTAATEVERNTECHCSTCGMYRIKWHDTSTRYTGAPTPIVEPTLCHDNAHVPHVWADCYSCMTYCVNPDA